MLPIRRPTFRRRPLIGVTTGILAIAFLASSRSASMQTSSQPWPTKAYIPRHKSWPYTSADFKRLDSADDSNFYAAPRLVAHIDDGAIERLSDYYNTVLPRSGRILDFCSSWISHYPRSVEDAVKRGSVHVVGLGMNAAELDANPLLNGGRVVADLNVESNVEQALRKSQATGDDKNVELDASTNAVSIDYLTQPVAVLSSLLSITKTGGTVHLAISNRCFPTKAIARWLRVDEEERLLMVGDFLHFAGWKGIEIVDLSESRSRSIIGLLGFGDPLWVVRAVKG